MSDLDIALRAGDLVWMRAANGFGKTTLLRVLAGLATPRAGSVARDAPLLYLAHANALKDDLTVAESVEHFAKLFGIRASAARRADAIERFGLSDRKDAPIRTLSQGQRRRVALTRLALSPPDAVWLLDEPYDALDTDGTALVNALLTAHAARGGCALLTSHVGPDLPGLQELTLDAVVPAGAGVQSKGSRERSNLGPGLRRGDGG